MISACCAAKLRPSISSRLNRPRHRGTEGRRGDGQVSLARLAERLRDFVDLNPDFETSIERLATWLARLDNDEDLNPFPERAVVPVFCRQVTCLVGYGSRHAPRPIA